MVTTKGWRSRAEHCILAQRCVYVTYCCLLFKCIYAGSRQSAEQHLQEEATRVVLEEATTVAAGAAAASGSFQQIVKSCLVHPVLHQESVTKCLHDATPK